AQDITDLTGIEAFTVLTGLDCSDNRLRILDISHNQSLVYLDCRNNELTALNAANENNKNFTQFNAVDNPGLSCIQVDDAEYSQTHWKGVDDIADFSEDCGYDDGVVSIPDQNFKA